MSDALLVRRGGSTKLFAAIGVTYPEGSTCTCTDGIKSFTAKDTSGKWIFPIPYAGTWTVSCTDGTETGTETVEITTQGQSINVVLSYWHGELYDTGRTFDNVTGGWSSQITGASTVTFEPDCVVISAVSNKGSLIVTNNAISFSGYTAIKLTLTQQPTTSGGFFLSVVSDPTNLTIYSNLVGNAKANVAVNKSSLNSNYEITLDVSAIDDGYVAFGGAQATAVSMTVKSILLI